MITANNLSFTPVSHYNNVWLVTYSAVGMPPYNLAELTAMSSDIRSVSYRLKWLAGKLNGRSVISPTREQAVSMIVDYYNFKPQHGVDNFDDWEE